jgi:capsular polysaccharide transport system permease protein
MSDILRGFAVQARNLRALVLRDMMMRHGRENIGFFWVILEPMILTLGVMVIWSTTMGSEKMGLKLVEVILCGYMPLTLWRHTTNSAVGIFRGSVALLYHSKISLFDIIASKIILEFIATTAALLVVWGSLNVFGVVSDVARFDLLMLGWLMMAWLATAAAMLLACATEYSEVSQHFVQPIQYLTIPISGAFIFVDWLPKWAQDAILLNPMVHCYEVFRAGFFGPSAMAHYSLPYFSACAFVLTYLGIAAVRRIRPRIQIA